MVEMASGTFQISMVPGPAEVGGIVDRFDFSKTFEGDLEATGSGLMLSSGDPASGAAGYVAIESVEGRIGHRSGGFCLHQLGMMRGRSPTLHYEIVPGSGRGEFRGISGTFHLTVDADGTHRYTLEYELPG